MEWSRELNVWADWSDRDDVEDRFPGSAGHVLAAKPGGLAMMQGQWGMIPAWAKDASFGKKNAYNARGETLLEKPTFRSAFKLRRCVVPASAFYEQDAGRWVRFSANAGILPMAGLYEPANRLCHLPSYAVVTTDPNSVVSPIQDRMPVVLSPEDVTRWLDPETEISELRAMLAPCPPDWFVAMDDGPIGKKKRAVEPTNLNNLFDDV